MIFESFAGKSAAIRSVFALGAIGLLAALPLSGAHAQSPETVLASHPTGGPDLVNAVASTVAAKPEHASRFCAGAGASSPDVQGAVGAGLAYGVQLLQSANDVASAAHVHATVCQASGCQGGAVASYSASMGAGICQTALIGGGGPAIAESQDSGPPPTMFQITASGHGGGSRSLASPN